MEFTLNSAICICKHLTTGLSWLNCKSSESVNEDVVNCHGSSWRKATANCEVNMKNFILILSLCGGIFSSSLTFAGEQEPVNCKKSESRAKFEERVKKLATEHCGKVKFKNLHMSSAPITIDKDPLPCRCCAHVRIKENRIF